LLVDLSHLVQMKNQFKKQFNGKYFINYLRKHPPPSANMNFLGKRNLFFILHSKVNIVDSNKLDKDSVLNLLINYAQILLDENLLCSCGPNSIV
jgi:hypothetical protein